MIISAHQVNRKAARAALKRVVAAGGHVCGAALSKFRINKVEYNYAYQYLGSYYYGYGNDTPRLQDRNAKPTTILERHARNSWRALRNRIRNHTKRS